MAQVGVRGDMTEEPQKITEQALPETPAVTVDVPAAEVATSVAVGGVPAVRYAGLHARMLAMFLDTTMLLFIILTLFPGLMQFNNPENLPPEIRKQTEVLGAELQSGKITSDEYADGMGVLLKESVHLRKLLLEAALETVLFAFLVIPLWKYRGATPGKMILGMKVVDAKTLGTPTNAQLVKRYFGYVLSSIPLGLGFVWIAFNEKRQGWHDMIADTLVIYPRPLDPDWKKKRFKRQSIVFGTIIVVLIIYNHLRN